MNEGPEHTDELSTSSTGIWRVTTLGSTHVLDLDYGTATRFPGAGASPSINDCTRPLRTLDTCRVGGRGRWTMYADSFSDIIEYFWQVTSTILRIERITADQASKVEAIGDTERRQQHAEEDWAQHGFGVEA